MLINNPEDKCGDIADVIIISSIVINVVCTFMLTFQSLKQYFWLIGSLELITYLMFCIEYVLRLWTSTVQYRKPYYKAIPRFLISWDGVIGIITIVPLIVPALPKGLAALRIIRVFRILHLFKVSKATDTFDVIFNVLKAKATQLVAAICLITTLMLSASIIMYTVENPVQPTVFENAFSGLWWAFNTVLTIGYGDIYPVTVIGKLLGLAVSILGVGFVAIPTGIISAGFIEHCNRTKDDSIIR